MTGSCYGFRPVSNLPFEYLRGGDGEPLEVREHENGTHDEAGAVVAEWTPIPGKRMWARLYDENGRYRLWVEEAGSFLIDPATPSVQVPVGYETAVRREERVWSIPALLCMLARGDVPLHAAAVDVDGEAVLLAAPGYSGKTTLAASFDAAGYRVLSEDISCIRVSSPPTLVPGPAMLRVRRDVAAELKLPRAREVAAGGDDRVHFSLDPARRGDCTPLPVRAVVFLRRSDNGIALERVPSALSLRELFPLSFKLPGSDSHARCFAGVTALADAARVWNLYRPVRLGDLTDVVGRIVADA